jgi:hypothetical protein
VSSEQNRRDKRHQERRRRKLAAFFERQRVEHHFINLRDLVDWCVRSTTTASVDQQTDARELAYKLLAESMLSGEFEQGRPLVRFLHPEVSRWRLNREQIKLAFESYAGSDGLVDLAAAENDFWRFCWFPRGLARQWLESHGYRWASHFTKEKPTPRRDAYRKGRTPQPLWEDARAAAWRWLTENGYPRPGDGGQADLERHIASFLAEHGYHPAESTVRLHVTSWIDEFRNRLGA